MRSHPAGHFRLAVSLLQQPRRPHPSLYQSFEISAYSRWKSHALTIAQEHSCCQYIMRSLVVCEGSPQRKRKAVTKKNLTQITTVLDRSGSMASVREATVSGFSESLT